jgi:hypothetical protein
MPARTRDVTFAAFVAAERPMLQGVAYLVHGRVDRAECVVEATLARLFEDWPVQGPMSDVALQRLMAVGPHQLDLPWRQRARVELIDTAHSSTAPPGIAADLAALGLEQRQVVILRRFAGLSLARIAQLTGQAFDAVHELDRSAREQLIEADREREDETVLAAQLAAAIPFQLRTAPPPQLDVDHGKQLVRRKVGRRLAIAAAAISVLVGTAVWAPRAPLGAATSPPTPVPIPAQSSPAPPCRHSDDDCRASVLTAWRLQMADVITSYLDPEHKYFSEPTHGDGPAYENRGFWRGDGGALGLDLSPNVSGATVVYLQVATSRTFAVRCGTLTKQNCVAQRFMDGNRFILTETTYPYEGLEVQFAPDGREVVTVVARNAAHGRALDISRGDLIGLVQDSRLRLPHA